MPRKSYNQPVIHVPPEYIEPLNINRLEGRMLRVPAQKKRKRQILLLYGSHSSIERMYSLAEEISKFGEVTLPDWPGFGGMDSMFKIGKTASVDDMADYLAAFVKLRYKRQHFTIVGVSYGFIVATRMLQKYPDIAKRVDFMVSLAGFVHKDDFHVPRAQFLTMKYGTKFLKGKNGSRFAKLFLHPFTITAAYRLRADRSNKMKDANGEELKRRINFEVILWMINDLRTYFYTAYTMFVLDLCAERVRIEVPMYHISVADDQFFDNHVVEQHLKVIYKQVTLTPITIKAHMPTIIASAKDVAPFIPTRLRRVLARPA